MQQIKHKVVGVSWKQVLALAGACVLAAHLLLWGVISNKGPEILRYTVARHLGWDLRASHVKASLLSQGVRIANLEIREAGSPEAQPFFTAKKVLLRFNPFSFFAGRVTVRKAVLLSPTLKLSRGKDGSFLLPRQTASPPASGDANAIAAESADGDAGAAGIDPPGLRLHKIVLRKGSLLVDDQGIAPPFWVRIRNLQGDGRFASENSLHFHLQGHVEGNTLAPFSVDGQADLKDPGGMQATLRLEDLDIALLSPYYRQLSPAHISSGSVSLFTSFRVEAGYLRDCTHKITLKGLTIEKWDETFLNGKTLGIPNTELAEYLSAHGDDLAVDFSMSGPLETLRSLSAAETWKVFGTSAVNQWLGRKANR